MQAPTQAPTLTEAGKQARQFAAAGVTRNADWTPYIEEIDGVKMALVPAGCFDMGSSDDPSEQPVHRVCFEQPFWVDVTEVTNGQFGELGGKAVNPSQWADADLPRENLTWTEASVFCHQRGARLLTEAEWEYAARGPDGLVFPWGNQFVADDVVYSQNSNDQPWSAGSKPGGVSWVGALDLSGNVWEWAADWYGDYSPEQVSNPGGAASGDYRVLRGGSWDRQVGRIRAANRGRAKPGEEDATYGFRCGYVEHANALAMAAEGVTRNADWQPYIEEIDGVKMALVPAGCFMMGSTDEQLKNACDEVKGTAYAKKCNRSGFDDEQPTHRVCFDKPFWIDVYEVTQAQFARFGGTAVQASTFTGDDLPRENVDRAEAEAFCQQRGGRLLTEAEWEYAARGPDGLIYPWGNAFMADNAVISSNSDGRTWEVGSKPGGMSWIGALDLSGNVWEWVSDWYSQTYYGRLADGAVNPTGPDSGEFSCSVCREHDFRVMRGGSWHYNYSIARTAYRLGTCGDLQGCSGLEPGTVGIRCGLDVAEQMPTSMNAIPASSPLPSTATLVPLDPVAYYSFDSGTAADDSGNGNDGETKNVQFVPGVKGQAAQFGGIDDAGYLHVPNTQALRMSEAASYSMWIRVDDSFGQNNANCDGRKVDGMPQTLIAKSGDRYGFVLFANVNPSKQIILTSYFGPGNGTNHYVAGVGQTVDVQMGTWLYVVHVFDQTGTSIYANGQLFAHDERPPLFSVANDEDMFFGIQAGKGSCLDWWFPLNGALDEVRIYARALSAPEIAALYEQDR
jgi:formylglycine-generating enzyme required for sulfatase activity